VDSERQPFVGPRPFEKADKELFFGRDHETTELLSLIVAHPVVLLYAQSGAGKTSMLNAGLIPALEGEGLEVFPPARVSGAEIYENGLDSISNIYIFNALTRWIDDNQEPEEIQRLSLAEFLATRDHLTDEEGWPSLRVIIFDQFEEIFTSHQEFREHRKAFFDQIRVALEGERGKRPKSGQLKLEQARLKGDSLLRVLLVIREDYLAQMDAYAPQLPEKLRTRFRIERLREDAALAAVTCPLTSTNSHRVFAPGVAERLVKDLTKVRVETFAGKTEVVMGEFVEPVQLQVVCRRLLEALPAEVTEITEEHLQDFGDVGHALMVFYEDCLAKAVSKTGVKEATLRIWFERTLITPAGTRGTVFIGQSESGSTPLSAVKVLEDLHLIRGEWRAGAKWYELTHDRLIEPIQESNRKWLAGRWETEQIIQRLEAKVAEWVRLGRGRGGLLDEVELLEVDRWMSSLSPADIASIDDLRALVENSRIVNEEAKRERQAQYDLELAQARAEQQSKAARYFRLFATTLLVLLLSIIGGGVLFVLDRTDKETERLSQLLAAQSISVMSDKPDLALLLSVEAFHKRDTFEAKNSLLTALTTNSNVKYPFRGHEKSVNSVSFCTEQHLLASGGDDNNIILWNTETGEKLRTMTGHTGPVRSVAFSPDGKMLASGSDDAMVIIWNVATGEPLALINHGYGVNSVAFGQGGRILASSSFNGPIIIWDTATGQQLRKLSGHADAVSSMAFDRDGNILASASYDKSIILWNAATGARIGKPLTGASLALSVVAVSPHGERVASDGEDKSIILWDVARGQHSTLIGHNKAVKGLAFSPDGARLASCGEDKFVILWDVATGQQLGQPLTWHSAAVNSVAFSPDGNYLATGGEDKSVVLWGVAAGPRLGESITPRTALVSDIAFSPDGEVMASASYDKTITLWDFANRSQKSIIENSTSVYCVAFSPDRKKMAWGLNNGLVLRDRTGAGPDISIEGVKAASIAFSPDSKTLAAPGKDNTVLLLNADTGQVIRALEGHSEPISSVAFSPDGRVLASAGKDKRLFFWDTNTGQAVGDPQPCYELTRLCFSPEGATLAYSGPDNTIVLCDVARRETKAFSGHSMPVSSIAFSPDGRMLASGSRDTTVILWDIVFDRRGFTLQMIGLPLAGHKNGVNVVAFSPGGDTLASSSEGESSIILWDINYQSWLTRACKIANRNLNEQEWRQYLGEESRRKCFPDKP
jgi:WD40 repeat protein